MTPDTNMRCADREEHHEELIGDGFEWCPECGATLYCRPDHPRAAGESTGLAPVVTGDCPPLTGADLHFRP